MTLKEEAKMMATVEMLREYHKEYIENDDKNTAQRNQMYDLMKELLDKFESISEKQTHFQESLDAQSAAITLINNKDSNRVTIVSIVGAILFGIGSVFLALLDPILQVISFFYHKTKN